MDMGRVRTDYGIVGVSYSGESQYIGRCANEYKKDPGILAKEF